MLGCMGVGIALEWEVQLGRQLPLELGVCGWGARARARARARASILLDMAGLCVGSRSGSSALADPTPLLLMLSRASSA